MTWSRPVAAWVFAASAALGGTHFWLYHLVLLLLRWLDSLLFWRLLRRVWPDRPLPAFSAALLFAVYPAFKQQLLALEYIPHFVALALLFSSIELNLRLAEPTPNRPGLLNLLPGGLLALLAWSGAFQVFIIEYFVLFLFLSKKVPVGIYIFRVLIDLKKKKQTFHFFSINQKKKRSI